MVASRSERQASASDAARGRLAGWLFLALLFALLLPDRTASLEAQAAARVIEGRVVRPGTRAGVRTPVAVPRAWVVLHRVGTDSAAPLDSMPTRADGTFRFRYLPTGDTLAVYFVSTNRGGVSYFTAPSREAVTRGEAAEILVFDSTSAPIPITVRGRHLVVTAPEKGSPGVRTVIEAYELSNDTTLTRVPRGEDGVTFDAPLPVGVLSVKAGDGEVSAEALRAADGRIEVNAPLAPGVKQLSFVYEVSATQPTEFLIETAVPVLEVLLEDPRGVAEGAGLVAVGPVEIEGRPFKRFLAENVTASQTVTVRGAGAVSAGRLRNMLMVTAVGAALLLGLGMVVLKQGPRGFSRQRDDDPEALAQAVAALDAVYERLGTPTREQKAEHHVARARLKGRINDALAKRDGLRVVLFALVPLALATAACGGRPAASGPVLTVDDFGDTVRLARPAMRIVSLNPVTTELLFALGTGERLVGRTHWDLHPAEARAVVDVGNGIQPNVEAVLGRTPDLVLVYASASNRAAATQLRAAGVMTMTLRTDRVQDLARVAPLIAEAIGDRGRGEVVADSVMRSLALVRQRASAGEVRPRVFWHVWDAPLMTLGAGSYLSELLDAAGALNVFGDLAAPSPQVTLEEVVRRDPDIVLAGPKSAAAIRAHPGWAAVRAVRDGRVLVVDTMLVARPGVRMGEAARHLRALIHGDSTR